MPSAADIAHAKRMPCLTLAELQSDHDCLRELLAAFEHAETSERRRDILRASIDLLDTHLQMESTLARTDRERAALFDLIEAIEMTDPASKLYFVRGLEFKRRLEMQLRAEEAQDPMSSSLPPAFDGALLQSRERLRARADALLGHGDVPTALAA